MDKDMIFRFSNGLSEALSGIGSLKDNFRIELSVTVTLLLPAKLMRLTELMNITIQIMSMNMFTINTPMTVANRYFRKLFIM